MPDRGNIQDGSVVFLVLVKRTLKDSVFTYLFRQPIYARELYLSLHPEDASVRQEDIRVVTLENVMTVGQYNDFGMQVRDRLIVLVEAQSTFSVNIAVRMLLYLAATYKEYAEDHLLDLYAAKPVQLPCPELYVVYTGAKADVPEVIRLSDLYDGEGSAEIELSVLRANGTGDIIDQYVRFCKTADEERAKHGYTEKAIAEVLRRCKEEGILTAFLAEREREVHDILGLLFSDEWIAQMHERSIREEGHKEGREEGRKEGREEGEKVGLKKEFLATVKALFEAGQTVDFMARITRRPEAEVMQALAELNLPLPS